MNGNLFHAVEVEVSCVAVVGLGVNKFVGGV